MSNDYKEYKKLCEEDKKLFDKKEDERLSCKCFEKELSFSTRDGFKSTIGKLVKYTLSQDIKWTYSRNASYFDEEDKWFSVVYVADTLCIMELRGKKKRNEIDCSGYIKVNENSRYVEFPQWKDIYSAIIAGNEYFTIENLLQKIKYKPRKLREMNWSKIVNEKRTDAIALEKQIQKYRKRNVYCPISYQKFLYEKYGVKYENIEIIKKIDEREIVRYVHFTNVENLDSIFREGLVPVEQLREREIEYVGNDSVRWDNRLDTVSLSVSEPNYQMFYRYKNNNPGSKWVVISYNAKLVADMDCAYFASNAASSLYLDQGWKEHTLLKSFESMFMGKRDGLYNYETTNPQAEVMVRGIIPSEYIETIFFEDYSLLKEYVEKYPYIKMSYDKSYFIPRRDFRKWSKGYSLD